MRGVESVKAQIVAEGEEDHLGFWSIVRVVQGFLGTTDKKYVRCFTFALLSDLLASGQLVAEFPAPNGREFDVLSTPVDELLHQVGEAWDKLGRDPTIGEIIWFATPDRSLASQPHRA